MRKVVLDKTYLEALLYSHEAMMFDHAPFKILEIKIDGEEVIILYTILSKRG